MKKSMLTIECPVHFERRRAGGKELKAGAAAAPVPGRIPRVARLMALAIKMDRLVREGQVKDHAELARLGRVTRARIAQIMCLLHLAPDIQEELLYLGSVSRGRDPVILRTLVRTAMIPSWPSQRQTWHRLFTKKKTACL
jgi:hypothetical protein